MATLRLTVQTITPLLMYGADQTVPELRGSAFRGHLRHWLRAVLGSQYTRETDLYDAESQILGSTEQGSRITVKVQASRSMRPKAKQWVLPKRTSRGYSPRYNAYPADSEFRLTLSTHPLDQSDVLADDSPLVKAVFLMAHFGGLGRRARRGSGNLHVIDAKGYTNDALPLAVTAVNRDELRDYLRLVSQFISSPTQVVGHRPRFATFAHDTCVVLIGNETHVTYEDAFDELWRVSGPYHDKGGIFGDVRPRRAAAVHMRIGVTKDGYVAQKTIFYSGRGAWREMKDYIQHCTINNFEKIYGDESGWS
jgi:CRISPR type III-B/RAMP module RAMP protein Cmr1